MHKEWLFLSHDRNAVLRFQTGVSLHSHTRHSKENLGFIGTFLNGRKPLQTWLQSQKVQVKRRGGISLDFDRAYWTPPLCEQQAWELEARQIESLGLQPIVSLSDHDTIEAPRLLRQLPQFADVPVSVEWSVPFGSALFHIGIHNLPAAELDSWMTELALATEAAQEKSVIDILAALSRMPGVLVVFNHPRWNFTRVAAQNFNFDLERFLARANRYLHAFEFNGMRSHRENHEVLELASAWNQVIISGGDRHGCEPNALLNLTNAADFPEFVDEIKSGKQSTILVMPQYSVPLRWRFYQNFIHVIREYPEHPQGRRHWDERTFHPNLQGEPASLSQLWSGTPKFLKAIFAAAFLAAGFPASALTGHRMSDETDALLRRCRASDLAFTAADSIGTESIPEGELLHPA